MVLRTFPVEGQTAQWEPEDVAAYLAGKGYVIGPEFVGADQDPRTPTTVVVRADVDPHIPEDVIAADLAAFAPAHDPRAVAAMDMRKAVAEVKAATAKTPIEDRVAALERVVLAYAVTQGVGG